MFDSHKRDEAEEALGNLRELEKSLLGLDMID